MSNRRPISGQDRIQLVWGAALVLMGIAFFFRIPFVMSRIADADQFASVRIFLHIALYLMAIILIGGGIKKLHRFWQGRQENL